MKGGPMRGATVERAKDFKGTLKNKVLSETISTNRFSYNNLHRTFLLHLISSNFNFTLINTQKKKIFHQPNEKFMVFTFCFLCVMIESTKKRSVNRKGNFYEHLSRKSQTQSFL